MDEIVYGRAVSLMEAELHDELVALDPVAGRCFGFNEVAAMVWKLLDEPKSIAELSNALGEDFDVAADQCQADVGELLDQLVGLGLVRILRTRQ